MSRKRKKQLLQATSLQLRTQKEVTYTSKNKLKTYFSSNVDMQVQLVILENLVRNSSPRHNIDLQMFILLILEPTVFSVFPPTPQIWTLTDSGIKWKFTQKWNIHFFSHLQCSSRRRRKN